MVNSSLEQSAISLGKIRRVISFLNDKLGNSYVPTLEICHLGKVPHRTKLSAASNESDLSQQEMQFPGLRQLFPAFVELPPTCSDAMVRTLRLKKFASNIFDSILKRIQ